jgi:sterol desaturase/sphingolipid hydroxylase (fatty acid hydroxylase superfamily)
MTMLLVFAVLAALFVVAERLRPARPQAMLRGGFFADVLYIPIHFAMRVVLNGTVAILLTDAARRLLPAGTVGVLAERPLWLQVVILLVTIDFLFYAMHRLKHHWDWWWRLHETHHSSMELDWLSTVRFHPLEKVLDRFVYLFPLIFFGASDQALLVWAAVDAFWGMLLHSNVDIRLGPLIYVFNGPEMHLLHHSRDGSGNRCNFGNNFSFFDWIFGTAVLAKERPAAYGVDDDAYPIGSVWKQFWYAFRPRG